MTNKLLRWAKTESEAAQLQSEGWTIAEQRIVHHHTWAILLEKADSDDRKGHESATQ